MRIELVRSGERGVMSRGHRVEIAWTGAEVPALYRIYRDYYGPHDGATANVFAAAVNREDFIENLDLIDARTVADATEADELYGLADRVRSVVGTETAR